MRRCFLIVAVFAGLVGAGTARTATFFLLDPNVASPGDRVTVKSPCPRARVTCTSGSVPKAKRVRFDLYLVKNDLADLVTSPHDSRLLPLGVLEIDETGHGALTFVVPDVGSGTYTIAHRRIGPCSHSGICGPAFYSAAVDDQIIPRYRSLMTLRIGGDDSSWPLAARYTWPLVLLVVPFVIALIMVALARMRRGELRPHNFG